MSQQRAATRAVLNMARRSRRLATPLYLLLILPHLQHCVWFWTPLFKKDINRLGWVQWRPSKLTSGWTTCPVRIGSGTWACSASAGDGFDGPTSKPSPASPHPPSPCRQVIKEIEPDSLEWFKAGRWETMDISWNKDDLIISNKPFSSKRIIRQWNRLPREVVQSPSLVLFNTLIQIGQALSNLVWTQSCPCFEQDTGFIWHPEVPSSLNFPVILWSYDSYSVIILAMHLLKLEPL